jgi:hypothetical protein
MIIGKMIYSIIICGDDEVMGQKIIDDIMM